MFIPNKNKKTLACLYVHFKMILEKLVINFWQNKNINYTLQTCLNFDLLTTNNKAEAHFHNAHLTIQIWLNRKSSICFAKQPIKVSHLDKICMAGGGLSQKHFCKTYKELSVVTKQ